MKITVIAWAAVTVLTFAEEAPAPLAIELRTGEKITVTKISKVEPDGITVWTEGGPKKIPVAKLSKAELTRFSLTEEAAHAHAAAVAKQEAARAQQDILPETAAARAEEKNELESWIGAGHQMAMDSYVAKFGPRFRNSGTFKEGPMKGKTLDQAIAQFEQTWATSPASVRLNWAKRAMMAGQTPEVQAAETAAKAAEAEARQQQAEQSRAMWAERETERRLKKLENAELERPDENGVIRR